MDESSADSFINLLRSDATVAHSAKILKDNFNQVESLVKEAAGHLRSAKKIGSGLQASISEIWRQNFSGAVNFTAEIESAVLEFIFVEKFGWNINDANFWYMNKGTVTRQNPLSYRNKLIGGSVKKIVRDVRSHINGKLLKDGQQRQVTS